MPNFRTAFHFFVKLEMVQENYRSAKLLASFHVIQYMIEHHFTYIWTILKYIHKVGLPILSDYNGQG